MARLHQRGVEALADFDVNARPFMALPRGLTFTDPEDLAARLFAQSATKKGISKEMQEFLRVLNPAFPENQADCVHTEIVDPTLVEFHGPQENFLVFAHNFYGKESAEFRATRNFFIHLADRIGRGTREGRALLESVRKVDGFIDIGWSSDCSDCKSLMVAKEVRFVGENAYEIGHYESVTEHNRAASGWHRWSLNPCNFASKDLKIPLRSFVALKNLQTIYAGVDATFSPHEAEMFLEHSINRKSAIVFDGGLPSTFSRVEFDRLAQKFPGRIVVYEQSASS
ncbi:MAG: hypothetical protein LBF24_02980 [Puniceicoccales bacterium]|jgi:hypothetical protein|nr:hypothetical protein [Puniceicoccales bacterium]